MKQNDPNKATAGEMLLVWGSAAIFLILFWLAIFRGCIGA